MLLIYLKIQNLNPSSLKDPSSKIKIQFVTTKIRVRIDLFELMISIKRTKLVWKFAKREFVIVTNLVFG